MSDPTSQTAAAWGKAKKTPAWLVGAASAFAHWAPDELVEEALFDETVVEVRDSPIGAHPPVKMVAKARLHQPKAKRIVQRQSARARIKARQIR
jgi:hypothetical protein